jgi:hypothetical protein
MWAALLISAGITALLFRNLLPDVATHLYSDLGDPLLNTAILAWNARQWPLTEAWWNFPAYAPITGVTAFTEHLLLTYPVASPIIWLTGNPVLAYNVVFLAAMPLNAVAANALARELLSPAVLDRRVVRPAALVAGLAYAFAPYQQVHLSHLQHMTSFGMPLALLWLHRYLRVGRPAALVGFGAAWFTATLANSALLFFVPLLVGLWCAWFVRPSEWRRLIAPAIAAAVATLPLLPLLAGYGVRQAAYGFTREYGEIKSFSADMVGVLGMYHRALPWRDVLPHDFEEGALFPGFTTLTLALVAVVPVVRALSVADALSRWSRRLLLVFVVLTLVVLARIWTGPWSWHIGALPLPPFRPHRLFTFAALVLIASILLAAAFRRGWAERHLVVGLAALVVVFWLTALGPEPEWSTPWRALEYGPYRLLIELPGVTSIRVPARAWFPAVLCLAMLAGCGAASLCARAPGRARAITVAFAAAIVAEGAFFDGTMEVPRPTRRGAIPEGATVLDLPWDEGYQNAVPQYRAVRGGYRTLNGYSGYQPSHVYPLRRAIADLVPDALDAYRRRGDLHVIVRPGVEIAVARWVATRPGAENLYVLEDGARVYRLPHLREALDAGRSDLLR